MVKKVRIYKDKSSGYYIAYFFNNNKLVQKIASPSRSKLISLKRRFLLNQLKFTEKGETKPYNVNKYIY